MAEPISGERIDLDYAKVYPKHWWHSKWVWRTAAVVALIWLICKCAAWGGLVLARYRCYRLEQQATQWPTGPQQANIAYTPPGMPRIGVSSATVSFQKSLWAARSAESWTATSSMFSATPVFCHVLTTPSGAVRLVQVYARIDPANVSTPLKLNLLAVSFEIHDINWVIHGLDVNKVTNWMSVAPDVATWCFQLRTAQSLSVTGGACDPLDRSTVTIGYTIGNQQCHARIHLTDRAGDVYPRMAMEEFPDPWRLPGSQSWYGGSMRSGFWEWPIAPPTTAK